MEINNFPITIAYNMRDKKIGCPLAQGALGSTLPASWVTFTFDTKYWEINPSNCGLFNINSKIELDFMIRVTKETHE